MAAAYWDRREERGRAGPRSPCVGRGCSQSAMSMSHLYGTDGEDGVEMENFEVSDWDLQNEFNPHRQRHRQSKEEATYGVWAERDSDEERPSFGGKRYGPGTEGRGPRAEPVPLGQAPVVPHLAGVGSRVGRARVAAPSGGGFQVVNAFLKSPAWERGCPRGGLVRRNRIGSQVWVWCSSRDYSAPVNFISAGLKKSAAEDASEEDSDEDEKPVKQEEIPKEFVPKKLKTVSYPGSFQFCIMYL